MIDYWSLSVSSISSIHLLSNIIPLVVHIVRVHVCCLSISSIHGDSRSLSFVEPVVYLFIYLKAASGVDFVLIFLSIV